MLDFAAGLEETLGHFWAIELNLNESNAQLAAVHATHPIAELYDAMKPQLESASPELDARFQETLVNLKDTTGHGVSRADAQYALDSARELVETVRNAVVYTNLSDDHDFKLRLMKTLLETSAAEYDEAVSNGVMQEMAEFQDGSAFVWRSQVIYEEIKSDLDPADAQAVEQQYMILNDAYDRLADPFEVTTLTNDIILSIDTINNAIVDERLDFAAGLEETLGHFWAIELNLNESNAQLAAVHATHPIAELYDSMKPQLEAASPALDMRFQETLVNLSYATGPDMTRAAAQVALDSARDLVEETRNTVVGAYISDDRNFRLNLMRILLETSTAEYGEAVNNGVIQERTEFQDGLAFVWRSQIIYNEIKSNIDQEYTQDMDRLYAELDDSYNSLADPGMVDSQTNQLISIIVEITGDTGSGLQNYIDTIRTLLGDAKTEYPQEMMVWY